MKSAVDILCQNGLSSRLEDWFFEEVQRDLRQRVSPEFWKYFQEETAQYEGLLKDEKHISNLFNAVEYLHKVCKLWSKMIRL